MNIRIATGGMIGWLGLGFLVHLIFLGTAINWSSAFTFFVILLWPFYLIYLFLWLLMWACGIALVVFLIYCAYCKITGRPIDL